jgi:hypothetical protein
VSAITERQADECVPAGDGERDASRPTIDAFGELMRRATKAPLSFGFVWHGMNFTGALEAIDGGMRLSLQSNLAQLPYSAEDAKSRGDLLAVVDTLDGKTDGLLKLVQGQKIILENEIPMPRTSAGSISSVVANLALLVLNAAPYLDLIAEFAPANNAA